MVLQIGLGGSLLIIQVQFHSINRQDEVDGIPSMAAVCGREVTNFGL